MIFCDKLGVQKTLEVCTLATYRLHLGSNPSEESKRMQRLFELAAEKDSEIEVIVYHDDGDDRFKAPFVESPIGSYEWPAEAMLYLVSITPTLRDCNEQLNNELASVPALS